MELTTHPQGLRGGFAARVVILFKVLEYKFFKELKFVCLCLKFKISNVIAINHPTHLKRTLHLRPETAPPGSFSGQKRRKFEVN